MLQKWQSFFFKWTMIEKKFQIYSVQITGKRILWKSSPATSLFMI